jgi:hypothetical protein
MRFILGVFAAFLVAFVIVHAAGNPAPTTATAAADAPKSSLTSINDPREQARIRAQREKAESYWEERRIRNGLRNSQRNLSNAEARYIKSRHDFNRSQEKYKVDRSMAELDRITPKTTTVTVTTSTRRVYLPR